MQILQLENLLNDINIDKLDIYEQMMYNNLREKSYLTKSNSLKVLINNVEGDYSQLSRPLKTIAKKFKMQGNQSQNKTLKTKRRYNTLKRKDKAKNKLKTILKSICNNLNTNKK